MIEHYFLWNGVPQRWDVEEATAQGLGGVLIPTVPQITGLNELLYVQTGQKFKSDNYSHIITPRQLAMRTVLMYIKKT